MCLRKLCPRTLTLSRWMRVGAWLDRPIFTLQILWVLNDGLHDVARLLLLRMQGGDGYSGTMGVGSISCQVRSLGHRIAD